MAVFKYRDPATGKFKRLTSGSGTKEVTIAEITGVQTLDDNTLALLADNTSYIRFNGGIYRLFSISAPTKTYISIADNANKRIIVDFTAKTCEYSETSVKLPEIVGTDGITIDKAADSDKIEISGKNFVKKNTTSQNLDTLYGTIGLNGIRYENVWQVGSSSAPYMIPYYTERNVLLQSGTPTTKHEVANKKYCDDNFVQKMTGNSVIYGQVNNDTPQTYSLATIDTRLNKNSIPLYNINTANNFGQDPFIKNVVICTGDPLQPYQAANKKYVDDAISAASTGTYVFKTLFGNQNIVGEGNIDLYRHRVAFTNTNIPALIFYTEIISSQSFPIDSLTDLKTYLGDTFTQPLYGGTYSQNKAYGNYVTAAYVFYTDDSGHWRENITGYTISDTVTTI